MSDVNNRIEMLTMFRMNPEKYLPVVDHAWKVFPDVDYGTEEYDDKEVNIGWDAGLLGADRPYFMEAWATGGITMLTYFVSEKGIEDATPKDLVKMLTDARLFRLLDPENPRTTVMKYEDDHENVFFSINVTVGAEDDVYVEDGRAYPYGPLNEYNSREMNKTEKK